MVVHQAQTGVRNRLWQPSRNADNEIGMTAKDSWTELWPSKEPQKSEPLLKALHILTRDGKLNADSRRKLKQVLHLVTFLRPAIETALSRSDDPLFADVGAGKS